MSGPLLTAETRRRMAISARALLEMPELVSLVRTEVQALFIEHPELPRSLEFQCALWALLFPELSAAVSGDDRTPLPGADSQSAPTTTETKNQVA